MDGIQRGGYAHIPHGGLDTLAGKQVSGFLTRRDKLADAEEANLRPGADLTRPDAAAHDGSRASISLRPPDGNWAGSDRQSLAQHVADLLVRGGCKDGHPGNLA